jgi:pimeloyl-ACP methyl ester carboxylesterase/DNA-binding SARP family transcriptional activator
MEGAPPVIIRVLGSVDVVDGDGQVHEVRGRRARNLMCRLVCDAGRVVPTDALIEAVWPDGEPAGPTAALQTHVFRLRGVLAFPGAPSIVTKPTGYQLDLATGTTTTDVRSFEHGIESAADAEPADVVEALAAALGWWRGAAYAGAEDVEALRAEQIRLEELHAQAVEMHAQALVATGRASQAIAELEGFVADWPLRPQACAVLMHALAAVGRDADALRVFQRHRRQLVEELGLEPSPELRRLESSVLAGELAPEAPEDLEGSDAPDRGLDAEPTAPTQHPIDQLALERISRGERQLAWAHLGTGPPVVVVPAWVSSLEVIMAGRDPRSALIERLADRHRVVTYDRAGTGLSVGDVVDFGVQAAVDELETTIERLDEPVALVGISGGGPIALAYAARRPERVSHLALFGTYADGPATFGDVGRPILDLLRQRPTLGTELLAGLYRPGASTAATVHLARALRDSAPIEVAIGYLEAIYATDVSHLVPLVRAPALVLHYRRDRVIPFAGGEALAAALPSVRFVAKDGGWHLPDTRDVDSIVAAMEELFTS